MKIIKNVNKNLIEMSSHWYFACTV